MADGGLFIGFGTAVTAREQQALELFDRATAYFGELQQQGEIDGFEPVLLEPHGGDLAGFLLVRGDAERLDRLAREEDFRRLAARATLVVESFGVVRARVDDGLREQIGIYRQQAEAQLRGD